jgi:hypothetical protein
MYKYVDGWERGGLVPRLREGRALHDDYKHEKFQISGKLGSVNSVISPFSYSTYFSQSKPKQANRKSTKEKSVMV